MDIGMIALLFGVGVAVIGGLFVVCALIATRDFNNGSNGR